MYHTTGELHNEGCSQLVFVNKSTHKPIPLPECFGERFHKTTIFSKALPMNQFRVLTKPGTGAVQRVAEVQPSHADTYKHTNHASYAKLCHEVGPLIAKDCKLSHLRGDLAFFRITRCQVFLPGRDNSWGPSGHNHVGKRRT